MCVDRRGGVIATPTGPPHKESRPLHTVLIRAGNRTGGFLGISIHLFIQTAYAGHLKMANNIYIGGLPPHVVSYNAAPRLFGPTRTCQRRVNSPWAAQAAFGASPPKEFLALCVPPASCGLCPFHDPSARNGSQPTQYIAPVHEDSLGLGRPVRSHRTGEQPKRSRCHHAASSDADARGRPCHREDRNASAKADNLWSARGFDSGAWRQHFWVLRAVAMPQTRTRLPIDRRICCPACFWCGLSAGLPARRWHAPAWACPFRPRREQSIPSLPDRCQRIRLPEDFPFIRLDRINQTQEQSCPKN